MSTAIGGMLERETMGAHRFVAKSRLFWILVKDSLDADVMM